MTIAIRPAVKNDVDSVRYVGVLTWPSTYGPVNGPAFVLAGLDAHWNAEVIAEAIRSGNIDVAESPEGIVGIAQVEELGAELVMWKLYVLPSQQHCGIGNLLVGAAKERARRHGGDLLTEYEPSNSKVRGFYEREGFEATSAPWPGSTAVWLRWKRDTDPRPRV